MDWKKLHRQFHAFGAGLGLEVETEDTNYFYGKSSTYYLAEPGLVYYKLRHSKPIGDYGSKLRIYSSFKGNLSVKARPGLFGKPAIKTNVALNPSLLEKLITLCRQIGRFDWTAEPHHKSWPFDLAKEPTLRFQCKRVDLAVSQLANIRKLHLQLLQEFGQTT